MKPSPAFYSDRTSSGEPVSYLNWGTGQPNNGIGFDDYAVMNALFVFYNGNTNQARFGSWNDEPVEGKVGNTTNASPHIGIVEVAAPGTNLVWIPPGTFTLGAPASESGLHQYGFAIPQHPVTLTRGFWMAKYEVTQREYTSLMSTNPSAFRGDDQRPVERVSWFDATEYCGRLTAGERAAGQLPAGHAYRLPTEAEWEYACRAGTNARWSFGGNAAALSNYAWHIGNRGCQYTNDPQCLTTGTTHPVGTKLPNPWGLYDLHGNVGEWVLDWYGPYTSASAVDPNGPAIGTERSYRGPAWDFGDVHSRSSSRWPWGAGNRDNSIGFRVVLAVTAPAGVVELGAAFLQAREDAGNALLEINRIGGSMGAVSVDYQTTNVTALAGSDFSAQSGTLFVLQPQCESEGPKQRVSPGVGQ